MNVADTVAVITGGARGIGFAVGRSLAGLGARVVLADVLKPQLTTSVDHIRAAGGRALGVIADVTSDRDVASLMDAAIETFGAINVVYANAGIIRDGLMLEPDPQTARIARVLSTDAFRAVLDVNVVGAFITLREGARRMADNRWPGLLLVTSSIHRTGHPGQINYSSSKAAVALWPKILVGELHSCGIRHIRVVGIAPGYTATEGLRTMDPVTLQAVLKDIHLGRLIEPEELAATIAHVIENEAIDATTIEVTAGATYGPWERAR
jgi:3-oxoacyl-[acyl-carrier protein] reductase